MSRHQEFHTRALAEARRYGQDELVFLRELAQNARDAGASCIEVTTGLDGDEEWVSFDDDGTGMTFEHARAYLFRLYASSKDNDRDAAGCFGVGFWSVLRWEAATVEVESRTRRECWALSLDAKLDDVRETACAKNGRGTRITLRRRRRARTASEHAGRIAGGLHRYCRYLRRAGSGFAPLPIRCDGIPINEPFRVPGPVSLSFASRDAEGVVGLGSEPRVELYARGLLVTTAAILDELEPGRTVPAKSRQVGGLAPVVLINSNRLELVLSRQAPLSNRVLRRLVRLARSRVRRLVNHVVDGACPRPWWERARDRASTLWNAAGVKRATAAAALAAVVGVGLALTAFGIREGLRAYQPSRVVVEMRKPAAAPAVVAAAPVSREGPRVSVQVEPTALRQQPAGAMVAAAALPYSNLDGYQGATVEVPDDSMVPWGLAYAPPHDLFFRAHTLDHYDERRGWLRGPAEPTTPYPEYNCRRRCVHVRLLVTGADDLLVVPLPTGHRLERSSLRFASAPVANLRANRFGEATVELPAGESGVLEYTTGPYTRDPRPQLEVPDVSLPPWLEEQMEQVAHLPPRRRVQRITTLVRDTIAYDITPETAAAFSSGDAVWLDRVLSLGAGDCDVKNGLNVLLLRRAGIPARMAVGIAGSQGRARPHLHAWTEYFIRGWSSADATGTARPRAAFPQPTSPALSVGTTSAIDPGVPPRRETITPASELPVLGTIRDLSPGDLRWIWGLGAVAAALLGVGIAVYRRVNEQVSSTGGAAAQQQALARMLRDALSHPESWRAVANLWHRRVLPTLAGPALSMADAIRRAADGTLFVSRQRSELARLAAGRGTVVLDGSDRVFGDVIGTLGAGVNLDLYDRLRPIHRGASEEVAHLDAALAPVNALLRRLGDGIECRICPALDDAVLRDVDLSAVRLPPGSPWPRRFVAVNPSHREVQRRLRLLTARPGRGAFLWLDWLLDHSELLAGCATRLRERAAAEALEELA